MTPTDIEIAQRLAQLPPVLDLLREIATETQPIEALKTEIRALLANAPPKPSDAPLVAPEAGQAAQEAEAAIDALLDDERAGRATAADVESGRRRLAAARAKDLRAAAEHASQVELVERRHAAHLRRLRPLQDELGHRGQRIDELRERARQVQRQEVGRLLLEAERVLGQVAATMIAIGPLTRPQRSSSRQPIFISSLPSAPDTASFAGYGNGGMRIVIDRDPRTPSSPLDLEFNSAQIAARINAELDAALESLTTTTDA